MVTGMLCWEMLWETIRLRKFGNLPSRLDCVFLLPHRIDADAYDKLHNVDGRQVLHEVEIVDARSPIHVAWLSHCPMQSGGSFLEQMEAKGMAYWSGEPGDQSQGRELLVKSNVRIGVASAHSTRRGPTSRPTGECSCQTGQRRIFRPGAGNAIGPPRNIGASIAASACRMIGALVSDRGWKRASDDPIPLPAGRELVTLEDAGNYITKLPRAEHEA